MARMLLSRRGFMRNATVLTVALAAAPSSLLARTAERDFRPHAILRIERDGTVRIFMPHADLGSGIYTGLAQIIADELDADWHKVVTEHLDSLDPEFAHRQWGVIATGASTSVANQWMNLRQAGASARALLIEAAARQWNVPAAELRAAESFVIDETRSRRLAYGELTTAAAGLTPPVEVPLKSPERFTLIGRSLPRLDRVIKSEGRATFGIDVQLPDMLHASIVHCPVFGGRLRSVDSSAAEAMPGVRKVVTIPTGVAVIADSFWRAKKACGKLVIEWDEGAFAATSSADLWREYAAMADGEAGQVFEQRGQPDIDNATRVLTGEMRFPFLAHAPMEPLNATARVTGERCEIWVGTQFQGIDVGNLEQATGIAAANFTIHTQWLGGSFGRRASPHADYLVEAVQIAQAAQLANPIKMLWQREDDVRGGLYRPMVLHRYRIGLDDDATPAHWRHDVVCASISRGTPLEAAFFPRGFDELSVTGLVDNLYAGANVEFRLHTPQHPVSVCWLRGEADTHTGPVVEGIVNRLAALAGEDPFAYRRRLLAGKPAARRVLGVLDALEQASGWQTAPAPEVFRGMAVHASFGSVCGFVVEITRREKRLDFGRVTAAFDCGLVINPDAVKAQVFSSVAFALSTVIGQQVEIERGRARQSNFHDYTIAALRHTPAVEVHLVDNGLSEPTGVGEVPVAPFIPALAEALRAATGQTIEHYPVRLEGYDFLGA
ncbi:MAG: molybdopterin cofactor-binding domain-containing protein [Gammaproteobacteria bacterium]